MRGGLFIALALTLPIGAAQADDVAEGKALFETNCLHCHAKGGTGTTMLGKRLGKEHALLTERVDLNADYVRAVLRYGIGSMPWYRRSEITDAQAEALAAYLARNSGTR